MRYFDTSFLVPIFVQQAFTKRVDDVLKRQPPGQVAVSSWTLVEFSSAIARQVRMRSLDSEGVALIERAFDVYIEKSFEVIAPTVLDFDLARRFLRRYETGLRSGDALHLAIASNHRVEMLYSLDDGLLRAGRLLGLPVDSAGRLP
jgi:predicted nucleic acid-binding protein